jgi:hypothetical protein
MKKKHKVRRSAETGEFVSKEYAEANPSTTETETVETESDNKDEQGERANTDRETA